MPAPCHTPSPAPRIEVLVSLLAAEGALALAAFPPSTRGTPSLSPELLRGLDTPEQPAATVLACFDQQHVGDEPVADVREGRGAGRSLGLPRRSTTAGHVR